MDLSKIIESAITDALATEVQRFNNNNERVFDYYFEKHINEIENKE